MQPEVCINFRYSNFFLSEQNVLDMGQNAKLKYLLRSLFQYTLADSGFFSNCLYQGGVKSTVSWVFEDLKFKISEGYHQNW